MRTLKDQLEDWTDWDFAAYALAISLGLMPAGILPGRVKAVFWTNNPVGIMLHEMLRQLAAAGILENRDEPDDQYRWNAAFSGEWD